MKTRRVMSIVLTLVFMLMIGGCNNGKETSGKASTPSWKVVSELKNDYSKNNSFFLNEKTGITVGAGGEIHYTKDGGEKWGYGINKSYCLFGICMVNDKIAYAAGNGSYVVKTKNGGASWKAVTDFGEFEPNHPRYISFVDENTGWVATPSEFKLNGKSAKLGLTKDGGETWEAIELPKDAGRIAAISLRTQNDGYVLDNAGNLYITKDGGKSFSKQPLGLNDMDLLINDAPNIALKFLDDKNALLCYNNMDAKIQAARSSDGGKTWIKETMPDLWGASLTLSPDGKILTATYADGTLKILSYN